DAFKLSSRKPKRKFALLLAYNGNGYYGMQRNPGVRDLHTIEDDLVLALVKAGCIPEAFADDMKELSFQRCARTDKGVSAAGQLVSLKLHLTEDLVDVLNQNLPPQIRVLGCKRVTRGFSSKSNCDARTYSYMLPTFTFATQDGERQDGHFCLHRDTFHRVNHLLSCYRGTHNFHNFTSGRSAADPSAVRYVMSACCGEPFFYGGLEYAIIEIKGQSFMRHQIRKMVALAVAVAKGWAPEPILAESLSSEKVHLPRVPGLGLVLERVHFDRHNARYGQNGIHQRISWEEVEPLMMEFKERQIYPSVVRVELEEKSMAKWLEKLARHSYGSS
uniref:Pseudouridylate synthase 1 homolog n=2 Tax=Latimeria chalumnae TaxID=7897 RepID=H3B8J2_LATCH